MTPILNFFRKYGLLSTWILACACTFISLYFGEFKRITPCTLCWYQRVTVFPLVIILGIAVWRKNTQIIPYVFPLMLIGLFISFWHIIVQYRPSLLFGCQDNLCLVRHTFMGPVSLPVAAFFGIFLMNLSTILSWISIKDLRKSI